MFSRLRNNLRGSILTAFSALLFLSFAMVGIAFNLAVGQYIRHSAITELTEAQAQYADLGHLPFILRAGLFGQQISYFYVDSRFNVMPGHSRPLTEEIAEALAHSHQPPGRLDNRRLRIDSGIFYVNAKPAFEGTAWYALFYVDITDISRFSTRVNMLLLLLVGIIWAVAMIVTTFLAGTLAQPLRVLSRFARQIGQGDFSPNPENFVNEEFEVLNQNLNYAAMQLAKYDNDQKTFFQNVSHDLRTPLMSIKSYAEGIKYGIMDAKEASETILEATNRLTGMVGDIIYISRIDNITTPDEDEVNLCALIKSRIVIHRPLAGDINIRYESSGEPIMISCIKSYIERAIDNLISNALRYARETVLIECCGAGNRAVMRISDDGIGFEPEALPHVFERFYRGKNGLSGIGLAIVKSIVDQHKGTATAENKEKGAVLTISLPRSGK